MNAQVKTAKPYPVVTTGKQHNGLPILFNTATQRECVRFQGKLYSLDVIDKIRADVIRATAPEMAEALRDLKAAADAVRKDLRGWSGCVRRSHGHHSAQSAETDQRLNKLDQMAERASIALAKAGL